MVHRSARSRSRESRREHFEQEETASVEGESPWAPPPLPSRPKLELVSSQSKSSWPFAPDNAPMGMNGAGEASTDRAAPETPMRKNQRTPAKEKTSKPRPSSKLFVWEDEANKRGAPTHVGPRAHTSINANIPGIPLPPATDDVAERKLKVRRQESVIAEAHAARAGIGRVHGIARNASVAVKDVIAGGFEVASYLGEGSIRAVRKFEAMPRRRQIIWVATPYAVVIVLVLLLVHLRSPESASATMIPQQQQIKVPVPAPARDPVPAPVPVPAAAKEEPVAVEEPAKQPAEAAAPEKIAGTWHEVQALTFLRAAPNAKAAKVTKLAPNSKVIVFREMPAKDGWLVAQRPGGEIGFLKASVLEPRDEKPAPVKKIIAGKKRAKKSKIDPLTEVERPRRRAR